MNRFHSKYHRKNHHTNFDTNNPDAGHDPIASEMSPFQGSFFLNGSLSATGSVRMSSIEVKNGSFAGSATLGTGGTVTVKTNMVTTSSLFFLTNQIPSGTIGTPYVSTKDLNQLTFTIASTQTADRSTIGWFIVQPV